MPATGLPRMTRGTSPQASVVDRPTASSACQIAGHVLDPDPVQLDVLPVGEVGGPAGVPRRDHADRADLVGGEDAAVDPDPQHEELVLELVRLERRGLAAVDPRLALGVEAPPAEPAAQVVRVDAGEARTGVDRLDPVPHVEAVVGGLERLVVVEGLDLAERPLALGSRGGRSSLRSRDGDAVVVPAGRGDGGHRWSSGSRTRVRSTRRAIGRAWTHDHRQANAQAPTRARFGMLRKKGWCERSGPGRSALRTQRAVGVTKIDVQAYDQRE